MTYNVWKIPDKGGFTIMRYKVEYESAFKSFVYLTQHDDEAKYMILPENEFPWQKMKEKPHHFGENIK